MPRHFSALLCIQLTFFQKTKGQGHALTAKHRKVRFEIYYFILEYEVKADYHHWYGIAGAEMGIAGDWSGFRLKTPPLKQCREIFEAMHKWQY